MITKKINAERFLEDVAEHWEGMEMYFYEIQNMVKHGDRKNINLLSPGFFAGLSQHVDDFKERLEDELN